MKITIKCKDRALLNAFNGGLCFEAVEGRKVTGTVDGDSFSTVIEDDRPGPARTFRLQPNGTLALES